MKKRKKYGKVLLTFVLVVALFTVQGLQIAANVTTPKPDLSNPTVTVNNGDQFVEAIQNAQDGDVIGLAGSCISIEFPNNYNLNSAKKL